jgi:predicted AlkP superfamily pyrophosphatase or phosphodiesterase
MLRFIPMSAMNRMSPASWPLSAALVTGALLAVPPAGAQAARHRAILVSFDGFSEAPMRLFSDSLTAPELWSLFRTGACAASSRPAFPSVTPTGHAAIYTGAYSNVNGIAAVGANHDPRVG